MLHLVKDMIDSILQQLRAERQRIDSAIFALEGTASPSVKKRRGRPPNSASVRGRAPKKRTRKPMSAAAKKKLSLQMKKRWAERKKAAKQS